MRVIRCDECPLRGRNNGVDGTPFCESCGNRRYVDEQEKEHNASR